MMQNLRLAADFLFLTTMLQLALCLYEVVCRSEKGRRILDGGIFLALLLLTAQVSAASLGAQGTLPLPLLLLLSVLAVFWASAGIVRTYRQSRKMLSPSAIKQALDDLDSGVLFADGLGRVTLANRTMVRLAETLTSSYPQMLQDLERSLASPPEGCGAEKIAGAPGLYRFADGKIWRFQSVPLTDKELSGYTQMTAQDVTELYEANTHLARENAELQEAIQNMRRMTERIADRIREEENLNLKMRIHNDIGTSLIALSEMARGGLQEDPGKQLELLHFAVSCFSQDRSKEPDTLADAFRQAEEMGVSLVVDGEVPRDEGAEQLIAAAAGECITNCVRHAKGKTVTVKIRSSEGLCTAEFTNDGKTPDGPIAEGGGLSALRWRVEHAGAAMHVFHTPRFLLVLEIKEARP